MRPSRIKPGTELNIQMWGGGTRTAYFVQREATKGPMPAVNYLRFPSFDGQNGPGDDGMCVMDDYELSRRGEYANRRKTDG